MALIDPKAEALAVQTAVLDQIKTMFPFEGRGSKKNRLVLTGLRVGEASHIDDLRGQKQAKLRNRTWAAPVFASLELQDKSGAVLDRQDIKVAALPQITSRLSYIVKGKEVQVANQWHLKAGAYARETDDGELEVHFNPRGSEFRINFDPEKRNYTLKYSKSLNIPLYSILKTLGVDHEDMESVWGKQITDANRDASNDRLDTAKLFKGIYGHLPADLTEASRGINDKFKATELNPEATSITLGEARSKADGQTMLLASKRLLQLARGESKPDNRDAIHFKDLWGLEDFLPFRLQETRKSIERKVANNLDRKEKINEIISTSLFNDPMNSVFDTALAGGAHQVNPIGILSEHRKTTSMGPMGGIKSEHEIKLGMRLVDNSHVGFLDPIPTPEGPMAGITLSLPIAATKVGRKVVTPAYNTRTGKLDRITPEQAYKSVVAFPDQFSWKDGKPVPNSPLVQASTVGNEFDEVAPKDVDYILPSAQGMFTISTNVIPFMQNDQGNRTNYASKQISQAIALESPEAPLVQVHTGVKDPSLTWEKVLGMKFSSAAPVDGVITEIGDDYIKVKGADRKVHEIQHYHNYPLNDGKSFISSKPLVKVGDMVAKGQTIADSNFTANGVMAYGVNARVAYLPQYARSVSGDTRLFWQDENGHGHFTKIKNMPARAGIRAGAIDQNSLTPLLHEVHAYIGHNTTESMMKVTTTEGAVVKATKFHSFITIDGHGNLVETTPQAMKPGETLLPVVRPVIPFPETAGSISILPKRNGPTHAPEVPADWLTGFVFGMYVSEGSCTGGKKATKGVEFAVTDADLLSLLEATFTDWGINTTYKEVRINNTVSGRLVVHSAGLAVALAKNCGRLAPFKRVPDVLWSAPREFAEGFLSGYWSGDGTVTKSVTASTASEELAEGLCFLLAAFGIRTTRNVYRATLNGVEKLPSHRVHVLAEYMDLLPTIVHGEKQAKLEVLRKQPLKYSRDRIPVPEDLRKAVLDVLPRRSVSFCKDYVSRQVLMEVYHLLPRRMQELVAAPVWWDLVDSVVDIPAEDYVYDLDMRPHGNFVVGAGLVVHNTFEDGIVISESFAKKLSSVHMYQERFFEDRPVTLNKAKYRVINPHKLTTAQAAKLDDDGVIKVGQTVEPGDTIVAALRERESGREQLILEGLHKRLARPYSDASLIWENETTGFVEEVVRNGREVKIHVKTVEAARVADKMAGRHGNKGVISRILPDGEMPRDKDGKPMEVLLNPVGVGARINPGQIYETMLGKIAAKNGGVYATTNFASDSSKKIIKVAGHWRTVKTESGAKEVWVEAHDRSYHHAIEQELAAHGITDREQLFDPKSGEELREPGSSRPGVLVGNQYMIKLEHTANKKLAARGQGAGYDYDVNMGPKGGGDEGGQRLGILGLYSMLAHDEPTALLREMQTVKSDRTQTDFWMALQAGEPLPPPKAPFAYEKFVGYLKQLGVNVEKNGTELRLLPRTDKEVLAASNGEVDLSKIVMAKDLSPEPGGMFDEKITGGPGGTKWSHTSLTEPFLNPLFEAAVAGVLGVSESMVESIANCENGVSASGAIVPADKAELVGGPAIEKLLKSINVKKELAEAKESIATARGPKLNAAVKKTRFLRLLDEKGLRPEQAYMMRVLPVLPPQLRPFGVLERGDLNLDDINGIYKQIGMLIGALRTFPPELPPEYKNPLRRDVYDGIRSVMGLDGSFNGNGEMKGILDIVAGSSPKNGFFAMNLMSRKQDLSMRGVIVPSEDLALDEVGLPREAAMDLFEPFVVRNLVKRGYTPLQAREAVKERAEIAQRVLDQVADERPVLLKRDPALHKFSIMGFKPKLISGKSIHLHPLTVGGFNADFDGDAMSVYVPVTEEAVREATKMFPSRNLFNEAGGYTMYQPTLESQLGLYELSKWGDDKGRSFPDSVQLLRAAKEKLLPYSEVVQVGQFKTTAGRVLLSSYLPKDMQRGSLLTSSATELDKPGLQKLMTQIAEKHPRDFAEVVDKLKDIGFSFAYKRGTTVGMSDLKPLTGIRDLALAKADAAVIRAMEKGLKGKQLEKVKVDAYGDANTEISNNAKAHLEKEGNSFYAMTRAGVKPSWDQLRQMIIAPLLLSDGKGRTISVPVRNSYAEGLSASEYWIAAHGARKGIIQKTGEVQEPGALNKKISATVVDMVVTADDCKTKRGVTLDSLSKEILDRYTAEPIKVGASVMPTGTLVTPEVMNTFKAAGIARVPVRSPLRCQADNGLCAKCYGVHRSGRVPALRENIGMMAGQSVGERSVQLVLKCSAGLVLTERGLLPWSVAVDGLGLVEEHDGLDVAPRPSEFRVRGKDGPVEATSVERHKPHSQVFLVTTRSGAAVLVQGDHPMIAAGSIRPGFSNRNIRLIGDRDYRCTQAFPRDQHCADPEQRVVQASDLTREDAIWVDYTPLLSPDEGYTPDYDGYIAGLYAGDGCLRYGNGTPRYEGVPVAIVFAQKEKNWGVISGKLLDYYGDKAGHAPDAINVYSPEAAMEIGRLVRSDYVASNGRRSQSKVLADDVSKIDRAWLRSFLDGLIDTDGYVFEKSGTTVANVTTTSIELATQMQAICVRLGISTSMQVVDDCPSRLVGDFKTAFTVQMRFPPGYSSDSVKLGSSPKPFSHAVGRAIRGYDPVALVRPLNQWEGFVYDVKTSTSEYMAGVIQNHNSFHGGGVAGGKELPRLDRLKQILNMPETLPGAATLAPTDGVVRSVNKDPAGGWRVRVNDDELYVPQDRGQPTVKLGDSVRRGHAISNGPINPRELLELSGLEAVQNYITTAMEDTYKGEGLRRRNFEVVTKAMTNLAQIDESGDHPDFLRGDLVNAQKASTWNRENPGKAPVKFKPVLKGLKTLPRSGTEDWLGRLNFEHLKDTVKNAASKGWSSDIHGASPIPGLAFGEEFGRPPKDRPWAY